MTALAMQTLAIVSLCAVSASGYAFSWDSPVKPFGTETNGRETMLITWKPVDDIQGVCEREYKRRRLSTFSYKVDACPFWNFTTRTCTIYTKKLPTMHDLGHEMRHCYQGNWH